MLKTKQIEISAYGPANLFDLTAPMLDFASTTLLREGLILAFSIGSTGALVELDEEEKTKDDFLAQVRQNFPFKLEHRHPGNAFAHIRSALLGTGATMPFHEDQPKVRTRHLFLLENTAGRKARRISLTAMSWFGMEKASLAEMKVVSDEFEVKSNGWIDLIDLTADVSRMIKKTGIKDGMAFIYSLDPDTALITLEYEPALILDLVDEIASRFRSNGQGPGLLAMAGTAFPEQDLFVPVAEGYPDLGTWQQICLVDLAEKGPKRILVQVTC